MTQKVDKPALLPCPRGVLPRYWARAVEGYRFVLAHLPRAVPALPDDERQAFEAKMALIGADIRRDETGDYIDRGTSAAWDGYQLARASQPASADFLWPHDYGSVEEAGYEVCNGKTPEYRAQWWRILLERAASLPPASAAPRRAGDGERGMKSDEDEG